MAWRSDEATSVFIDVHVYRSVPGKCSWALNITRDFWPAWALTWDQNSIRLYKSCYYNSGPLKCGTWALTQEWALAQDTTVTFSIIIIMETATKREDNLYYLHRSSQQLPVSRSSRHVEGSRIAKQLAPYIIGYMYIHDIVHVLKA